MGKGFFGKLFQNIGGRLDKKAGTGKSRAQKGKTAKKPHGFFPDPDDPDFEEKMMLIHMLEASEGDDEDLYVTEGIYLGDDDLFPDELTITTVETEKEAFADTAPELIRLKKPKQAKKSAGADTDFYDFGE